MNWQETRLTPISRGASTCARNRLHTRFHFRDAAFESRAHIDAPLQYRARFGAIGPALITLLLFTLPTLATANQSTPIPSEPTWATESVCYEIFVRSFSDSNGDGNGDLNGLTAKLDYLNDGDPETSSDLGVNCLWLLPVAEAFSYHGYDTTDYYTVESDYGTNDDFKRFIAEAHKRGIHVFVDLVLNHTSNMHPWFQAVAGDPNSEYRHWYVWDEEDPGYLGPWGEEVWHGCPTCLGFYYGIFSEGMPDLNYRNPAVTAEVEKISEFWLNEMGVDGFRLDAIKHLIEDGRIQENTPETHDWLREYYIFLDAIDPDAFTIGEIAGADATTLAPYYPDQTDSLFAFEIGEAILAAANHGETQQLISVVEQTEELLPDQRYGIFLTNHDQPRTMTTLGEIKEAKVAATTLLTLPGMPFIYYGEEIGMSGPKPDEQIRTPMEWSDASGGGFTTGTPWEPFQDDVHLVNVASQQEESDSLWRHYQRLIEVRATHPALQHGVFIPVRVDEPSVTAYIRQSDEEAVLVVLNFGRRKVNQPVLAAEQTGLEPGSYALVSLLDRQPMVVLDIGENGEIIGDSTVPSLNSKTGAIFRLEKVAN